jgi:hypothetical protein
MDRRLEPGPNTKPTAADLGGFGNAVLGMTIDRGSEG